MKQLFLLIICAISSLVLYASTPDSNEPVETNKNAIALHLKPSKTDIHRIPSFNTTTLYGYYHEGMLYINILDIAEESTECVLTISDFQIVTTAFDLHQGIYVGESSACEIEIQIAQHGVFVGFLD